MHSFGTHDKVPVYGYIIIVVFHLEETVAVYSEIATDGDLRGLYTDSAVRCLDVSFYSEGMAEGLEGGIVEGEVPIQGFVLSKLYVTLAEGEVSEYFVPSGEMTYTDGVMNDNACTGFCVEAADFPEALVSEVYVLDVCPFEVYMAAVCLGDEVFWCLGRVDAQVSPEYAGSSLKGAFGSAFVGEVSVYLKFCVFLHIYACGTADGKVSVYMGILRCERGSLYVEVLFTLNVSDCSSLFDGEVFVKGYGGACCADSSPVEDDFGLYLFARMGLYAGL